MKNVKKVIAGEECYSLHHLVSGDLTRVVADEWERNLFHGSEFGSFQKKTWGARSGTGGLYGEKRCRWQMGNDGDLAQGHGGCMRLEKRLPDKVRKEVDENRFCLPGREVTGEKAMEERVAYFNVKNV